MEANNATAAATVVERTNIQTETEVTSEEPDFPGAGGDTTSLTPMMVVGLGVSAPELGGSENGEGAVAEHQNVRELHYQEKKKVNKKKRCYDNMSYAYINVRLVY